MAAHTIGSEKIIAVDVFAHKLELTKKICASHKINADYDVLTEIIDMTDGKGIDYSIEAAGRKETMETSFELVRNCGGKCIIAGNLPSGEEISIDPVDLIKGKTIVETWGGETKPDRDIFRYIEWFLSGTIELDKLITHEYKLEKINQAFDEMERGRVGRALVDMRTKKIRG